MTMSWKRRWMHETTSARPGGNCSWIRSVKHLAIFDPWSDDVLQGPADRFAGLALVLGTRNLRPHQLLLGERGGRVDPMLEPGLARVPGQDVVVEAVVVGQALADAAVVGEADLLHLC